MRRNLPRRVQTITAISKAYNLSRFTLIQAIERQLLGNAAYKSANTWLIDTRHSLFLEWLSNHTA